MDENRMDEGDPSHFCFDVNSGKRLWRPVPRRAFLGSVVGGAACASGFSPTASAPKPPRRKIEIAWHGVSLRSRLMAFAAQQEVEVFLDRRIDPDQYLDFELRPAVSPIRALDHIADAIASTLVPVDSVIAVIPAEFGDRLGATWRALQTQTRNVWGDAAKARLDVQWNDGETPRDIAARAAASFGITLVNPHDIPHDVWPGYHFSKLTAAACFMLLLNGFEQTLEVLPSRNARLIRAPRVDALERWLYAPADPPGLSEMRKKFSELKWQRRGDWFVVSGHAERLAAAAEYFRQLDLETEAAVTSHARDLYTLTVEQQPVGAILKTLEQRAGLKFNIEDEAAAKLSERVSFEVVRVPLRALLKRTLQPVNLRFQIEGENVIVERAPNRPSK